MTALVRDPDKANRILRQQTNFVRADVHDFTYEGPKLAATLGATMKLAISHNQIEANQLL